MEADKAGVAGEQDKSSQTDQKASTEPKIAAQVDDVGDAPDPDEDDLDDLDDMLEEFATVKLNPSTTAPTHVASATSTASTSAGSATGDGASNTSVPFPDLDGFSEDEFQKQLQAGMAELMGDLEGQVSFILSFLCGKLLPY